DVIFGNLQKITAESIEVKAARLGTIHIRRDHLRRFYRVGGGADLLYLGPHGLNGWDVTNSKGKWKEDRGHPYTDQDDATLRRDFKLPGQVAIELEISWKKANPNFSLALGVGAERTAAQQAFKLETWGKDIVVQREIEREADVASVHSGMANSGRIHLQLYL